MRQFHILYAEVQGKRSFIILDFYCHQARLVIEADGLYHTKQKAADSLRDEILLGMKVKTLRFDNESILNNMEGVCKIIDEVIESTVSNGGEKETGA